MKKILMKIIRRINREIRLTQKKIEFRRKDCSLGKGVSFNEDTILFGHNKIGKNSEINSTVMGEYSYIGKDCWMSNAKIGKYSSLAAGISIAYGTHPTEKFISTHPAFFEKKPSIGYSFVDSDLFNAKIRLNDNKSLHIGNDCWIMQNATLIEGITIGDGAIVMSGAVVTKDVPPYAIVGGVPAKIIKYRFSKETIELLLRLKWWELTGDELKQFSEVFGDVSKFISEVNKYRKDKNDKMVAPTML